MSGVSMERGLMQLLFHVYLGAADADVAFCSGGVPCLGDFDVEAQLPGGLPVKVLTNETLAGEWSVLWGRVPALVQSAKNCDPNMV